MKCDKCDNEAVRTSLNSHLCADCYFHLEPKPDEGRLLTEWEIYEILDKYIPYDGAKDRRNEAAGALCREIEVRLAKTASIKDAECVSKLVDMQQLSRKQGEALQAECQARIEALIKDVADMTRGMPMGKVLVGKLKATHKGDEAVRRNTLADPEEGME